MSPSDDNAPARGMLLGLLLGLLFWSLLFTVLRFGA
jgi:hypothetical protein